MRGVPLSFAGTYKCVAGHDESPPGDDFRATARLADGELPGVLALDYPTLIFPLLTAGKTYRLTVEEVEG